ncbi:MAG: response regulator [Candidatus Firestonebacteria bacterium]
MILIVDDQQDICDVLGVFLQREGYKTEIANSGNLAIEMFKKNIPTLVFLDIRLPDIYGIDVLKVLKEMNAKVPIIMITAYRDAEVVVQSFRLGACDCIFKPFDFNYIKTVMMSTIGKGK